MREEQLTADRLATYSDAVFAVIEQIRQNATLRKLEMNDYFGLNLEIVLVVIEKDLP